MVEVKLDKHLESKIDLIAKRITGKDNNDALLIITSPEGGGKTNLSVILSHVISKKTDRKFDVDNLFFNAEPMIKFAQETKGQIIVYDEPALDSLSSEWWKKSQRDLLKLLMMARKKRHLFIFNITKITKFNEYIIDRAIGMIRVYTREGVSSGRRFIYYKKKDIHNLYGKWKSSHKLLYNKYKSFHGTLPPYLLPKIIDEDEYEKRKDAAIMEIGKEDDNKIKGNKKLLRIQLGIAKFIKEHDINQEELAKYLGINRATLSKWGKIDEKHPISLSANLEKCDVPCVIINNGNDEKNLIGSDGVAVKKKEEAAIIV